MHPVPAYTSTSVSPCLSMPAHVADTILGCCTHRRNRLDRPIPSCRPNTQSHRLVLLDVSPTPRKAVRGRSATQDGTSCCNMAAASLETVAEMAQSHRLTNLPSMIFHYYEDRYGQVTNISMARFPVLCHIQQQQAINPSRLLYLRLHSLALLRSRYRSFLLCLSQSRSL